MTTNNNFTTNKIELVLDGYNAKIAGLQADDEIVKINGKRVINQEEINNQVSNSKGEKVKVLVKRENDLIEYEIIPNEQKYKETGIYLKDGDSTKIVALQENSSAKLQGIQENDVILKINDEDVENNIEKLIESINENENKELRILVRRNNEEKEFTITPEEKSRYYLGINLKVAENTVGNKLYYSFHETLDFCFSIIENLKQLFTGKVSTNQLMGPVGISSVVSSTEGLKEYIYIIALISLSLGVTNLLPFPPLDGGKILLLIITAVRRKEFEEKTEMFIQSAGFFILITLSIYITCNDVWRIFK
ncbi:MAG TPA: site-2 protease family protein [Clostridiaceae bacterium]|jgi:regulator of sigma E protease|nr:site-2 protease family protein [Clostridiaceae bacterium]